MGEYLRPMSELIDEAARKISADEAAARIRDRELREYQEAERRASITTLWRR